MCCMSKELRLELSEKGVKPLFNTITKHNRKVLCLFDTGATMPVWCKSRGLFNIIFPDAELFDKGFLLSGFGKTAERVDVYKIPTFYLSDNNSRIEFRNLLVATSFDRDFGCDLDLSYTLFNCMDYTIFNRGRRVPTLNVIYDRDVYYISPVVHVSSNNVLARISSFSDSSTGL